MADRLTLIGLVGGVKMWFPQMVGGRGWIAIALVIFDRRRPWCALAGALLFGGIESLVPGSPPRASARHSISC